MSSIPSGVPPFPPGLGSQPIRTPLVGAWGMFRQPSSASSTAFHQLPDLDGNENASSSTVASPDPFYDGDDDTYSPLAGEVYVQISNSMQNGLSELALQDPDDVEDASRDTEPQADWETKDFTHCQTNDKETPALVCTHHGPTRICKKGICAVRSKMEHDAERKRKKEEAEIRMKEVEAAGTTKKGRKKGKGRGQSKFNVL
jgi:hypothetical protein